MASIVRSPTLGTALAVLVVQLLYSCLQTGANAAPPASCPAGYMSCGYNHRNRCLTYVKTDLDNCGTCGTKCNTPPHSSRTCSGGKCGFTCSRWWKDCDRKAQNGCEICVQGDVRNCGDCKVKCDCPPHAISTCVSGRCGFSCKDGFKDCNKLAADGCEVAIASDASNCGACGTACSTPHARPKCSNGTCAIKLCRKGFSDCNGVVKDGCEVTDAMQQTDPLNCGACGNKCKCPSGRTPACAGGLCTCKCQDGFEDCNGAVGDGCEAELAIDVANCGGCGKACTPSNANPLCLNGTCGIESCKSVFADCNGLPGDGCEVELDSDLANCGVCEEKCDLPNANPRCSHGACVIESCKDGFVDCNGRADDGCEVDLGIENAYCGACEGEPCYTPNAYAQCTNTGCLVKRCLDGFNDCNGDAGDGCEVKDADLLTDSLNCGACAMKCDLPNANSLCSGGTCGIESCKTGFEDCNGLAKDGCEVILNTNLLNCGLCNNSCSDHYGQYACLDGNCAHCSSDLDCVDTPYKMCDTDSGRCVQTTEVLIDD